MSVTTRPQILVHDFVREAIQKHDVASTSTLVLGSRPPVPVVSSPLFSKNSSA